MASEARQVEFEAPPGKTRNKEIRILMADDHALFRMAVRDILEKENDFVVVAEAENGVQAVRLAFQYVPDIVIMDISMPQLNGLEATRQIKAKFPNMAVLVLTVHDDIGHIIGILEAGAAGYLTKNVSVDEVVIAVRSVVAGETVIATPIFQQVLKNTLRYLVKPLSLDIKDKLTKRELELLKLAAKGSSNKEIALQLNYSLNTVKSYMVEIFSKLNVGSRTEAVILGLRGGLITSDDLG
jgi:NarL family two-component system response regulator LiaR